RNSVKIKVRQPLAELKVQPGDEGTRRAVERFPGLIREELNLRDVTLHDPSRGPLLRPELKLNMKTVAPKYSRFLPDIERGLAALDPFAVVRRIEEGQSFGLDVPGHLDIVFEPADVLVRWKAADGWAGAATKGTQVVLDVRITEELARAGLGREVVRLVNN